MAARLFGFFENRLGSGDRRLLFEVADFDSFAKVDAAPIGLFAARQDSKQSRLAGSVPANQRDLLFALDAKSHADQDLVDAKAFRKMRNAKKHERGDCTGWTEVQSRKWKVESGKAHGNLTR